MQQRHNPKITIRSRYYDLAEKYNDCTRQYRYTCQLKYTSLYTIIGKWEILGLCRYCI